MNECLELGRALQSIGLGIILIGVGGIILGICIAMLSEIFF